MQVFGHVPCAAARQHVECYARSLWGLLGRLCGHLDSERKRGEPVQLKASSSQLSMHCEFQLGAQNERQERERERETKKETERDRDRECCILRLL